MATQPFDRTVPAGDAKSVTPNDSTDLPDGACRALYVGTSGNVNLDTIAGTTLVLSNVQDGSIIPIEVKRVRSTSTTASNIVALY